MSFNGMPSSFPQNFLYQIQSSIEESLLPTIHAQDLRGFASMPGKRKLASIDEMGEEDDLSDDCMHLEEKKRRLNLEQVRTLEKSFEIGSKLEPERKMQLAHELGLKPRQIAIWFQNRRARWKTKKMEIDFEALKRHFDALNRENEALLQQNKMLKAELLAAKGRNTAEPTINLNKETEGYSSSSDINLDISKPQASDIDSPQNPNDHAISFFPSFKPHNVSQFLHSCNSRVDSHYQKAGNNGIAVGQEENFCNLFSGIDDQSPPAFWAWSEQHNFQ